MQFKDIPGHEDVKQQLRAMVDDGHLPHALMLEGPEGSGKLMLARALAQYIHCTRRHDGDSCGECPACIQHKSFNHIDTIYSFPVVGPKSISDDYIDDFRRFVTDNPYMDFERWAATLADVNKRPQHYVEEATSLLRKLSYTTHEADYKVVVMWLPEAMGLATANKLLKIVEEPADDTVFIMVSDRPQMVLPTIYSRTRRIAVKRYSDPEVAAFLEGKGVAASQAADIASLAQGSINSALALLDVGDEVSANLERFVNLMRKAYSRKVGELRVWSEEVADLKREGIKAFLQYCLRMIRENYISNLKCNSLVNMTKAEAQFAQRFAPFINERNVEELDRLFNQAYVDIHGNGNAKIVLFDLATKVIISLRR